MRTKRDRIDMLSWQKIHDWLFSGKIWGETSESSNEKPGGHIPSLPDQWS